MGDAAQGRHRRRTARLGERPGLLRQLQGGGGAREAPGGRAQGQLEPARAGACRERGTGFGVTSSPDEIESETLEALRAAVATLESKAPDEVEAYKSFVLDVAQSVAEAADGGSEAEEAVVEKVRSALSGATGA